MTTLNHYLILSALLFSIGTAGVFLRRNLITLLLSIEIMLNAVNLTFVAVGPLSRLGRRADHHVLRDDRGGRRSRRRPGAGHRPVPAQGDAEPGRVHLAEVVARHIRSLSPEPEPADALVILCSVRRLPDQRLRRAPAAEGRLGRRGLRRDARRLRRLGLGVVESAAARRPRRASSSRRVFTWITSGDFAAPLDASASTRSRR